MRVLMLGWEFPPHISGGLGTACHGLTQGLSRLGVGVSFVVPRVFGDEDDRFVKLVGADRGMARRGGRERPAGGASLAWLPIDSALAPYLTEEEYAERVSAPRPPESVAGGSKRMVVARRGREARSPYGADLMAEVARYAGAVRAIAKRGRFDVIHAHDWMTYTAGIAAADASGKPLVVHVHACEHDRSGPGGNARIASVEQQGFDAADAVVCVSRYTARTIDRHYRVDRRRVRVIHNGVAPLPTTGRGRRAPGIDDPVVLFLGRVTRQKGPDLFLDAAARIARSRPDVKFVMVGSGDLLPGVIERAATLGLSRRIHFTGFLEGEDIERIYAMADVYVMPSVSEPFGIAPLEALRRSVPVVLSRDSGVAEVLRSVAKVDPSNAAEIAAKTLALLDDRRLARRKALRGRAESRRMRWIDSARKTKAVYEEVTA